ncbi:hypothetical protein CSOJ01_10385 [Colletotrichum sojae]|uniref:Mid2 domain-containing protein n=1 Tax=Colletotrichum sojae TaxID=2175907 RepID=A0A8H6J0K7_9PEZI|nr:hypothetical protein CSOJ01_10385 [Colletotrichum sojae]
MHHRSLVVAFALVIALAQTGLALNQFSIPQASRGKKVFANNQVYEVGKDVTFTWRTEYTTTDLYLWSELQGRINTVSKELKSSNDLQYFTWVVNLDGFPNEAKDFGVFFLALYKAGKDTASATSHYINITQASSTATATSDCAAQQDGGLNAGTVAGIAIGAALGTAMLIGVVGFLMWKRHQSIKRVADQGQYQHQDVTLDQAAMNTADYAPVDYATPVLQQDFIKEPKSPAPAPSAPLAELGSERPSELGSNRG